MDTDEQLSERVYESAYLDWVKTNQGRKWECDLSGSGVPGVRLSDLRELPDLEPISGQGGRLGFVPLLEAIGREYDVPVECIVKGGGTSGANTYVFLLLLGPGDDVLVETPAYDILPNLARFTGASVRSCVRDPEDIARLIRPATKMVVLTNLHNPTSALMDGAALERIGEVAARNGVYVVVDEVYLDCVWENRPKSSFHLGPNFIVTSSLTKVYGLSGLRCGWIFAQPDVAMRLRRLIDLFDNIPSHTAELLSVAAFRELPRLRAKARELIEGNRAIYREFAERVGFDVPPYGTVVFPRVGERVSERLLQDFSTRVVPGRFFGAPEHVRIGLVGEPGALREGLRRLEACLAPAAMPAL